MEISRFPAYPAMNGTHLMAKTGIFIQARTTSSRLPGKVLLPLPSSGKVTLIEQIYARLIQVCGTVVVLAPFEDDKLIKYLSKIKIPCFPGPLEDVRERYRLAASYYNVDYIVRATGDNPCVDPAAALNTIERINQTKADLFSFSNLPLGCAVEAFTKAALFCDTEDFVPEYKEHVSLHIKHHPEKFHIIHEKHPSWTKDHSPRLTVDEEPDYHVVNSLFLRLGNNFTMKEIAGLYEEEPEFFQSNAGIVHNYYRKEDIIKQ